MRRDGEETFFSWHFAHNDLDFFPFSYQCEKCPKDNGERKKGVKIQIKAKVVFELSKRKTSRILSEFFSRPNEMEDEENWPIQSQKAGVLPGPTSAKF